jgi:hypothetical protein
MAKARRKTPRNPEGTDTFMPSGHHHEEIASGDTEFTDLPPIPVPNNWNVITQGCPACNRKDRLQLWIPAHDRWDLTLPSDPDKGMILRELVAIEDSERTPQIRCCECLMRPLDVPASVINRIMWDDNHRWQYGH